MLLVARAFRLKWSMLAEVAITVNQVVSFAFLES